MTACAPGNPARRPDKRIFRRGFTFVEILITLAVLSIAVLPLMQLFATAVEQSAYTDDLTTALALAREEVEKLKNLALTPEQIKQMGNVVNPPVQLQKGTWYTVRVVDPEAMPLEFQVYVYRGKVAGTPLVRLVAIVNK